MDPERKQLRKHLIDVYFSAPTEWDPEACESLHTGVEAVYAEAMPFIVDLDGN
jgi:hypothetical protein